MQNNSAPVELNSFYFTFNFKLNLKLFPELKIHFFLCHLDSLFLNIYKLIFFYILFDVYGHGNSGVV